jgi:regulator of RNase E activity RraB
MEKKKSFFHPDFKELVRSVYRPGKQSIPFNPYERKACEELEGMKQAIRYSVDIISNAALAEFVKERLVSIIVYLDTLKEIVNASHGTLLERADGNLELAKEMADEKEHIIGLIRKYYGKPGGENGESRV